MVQTLDEPALDLVRRIAIDTVAPRRRHLLLAELSRSEWGITVEGLHEYLRCDAGNVRRHMEDLEAVGLVEKDQPVQKAIYTASPLLLELASGVFLEDVPPKEALRKLFDLCNNLTQEERKEREGVGAGSEGDPSSLQR